MNSLEQYIKKNGIDECVAMNLLADAGVVSDNAVKATDVAEANTWEATLFLESRRAILVDKKLL